MDPIMRATPSSAGKISSRSRMRAYGEFKKMVAEGKISSVDRNEFKKIINAMSADNYKQETKPKGPGAKFKKVKDTEIKGKPKSLGKYLEENKRKDKVKSKETEKTKGSGMIGRFSVLNKGVGKETEVSRANIRSSSYNLERREQDEKSEEQDREANADSTVEDGDKSNSIDESLNQTSASDEPGDLPID